MIKRTIICLFIIQLSFFSQGQNKEEKKDPKKVYSLVTQPLPVPEKMKTGWQSISQKDLSAYLEFIADDLMEGRETAAPGYQIASKFAATMFSMWGLKPAGDLVSVPFTEPGSKQEKKEAQRSYFQKVDLKEILNTSTSIFVECNRKEWQKKIDFRANVDYQYQPMESFTLTAPIVFVGYGLEEKEMHFAEYQGINVSNKIVMMLSGVPRMDDDKSPFMQEKIKEKYLPASPRSRMGSLKTKTAEQKGALAVLLVESMPEKNGDISKRILDQKKINDERPIFPGQSRNFRLMEKSEKMPWDSIPTIRISREMANAILGLNNESIEKLKSQIDSKLTPASKNLAAINITVKAEMETQLARCANVLGYIEGSDPQLKDEVIVIGAHFDHLGRRGDYIFNGADDDGSGSVAVMELAQAFAQNPDKPKRSILFALWTGEEKGLLGSRFYVTHPFFPLGKTLANLTLDMVSRSWTKDQLKNPPRWLDIKLSPEEIEKINADRFFMPSYGTGHEFIMEAIKNSNQYQGMSLIIEEALTVMGGSDHAPFARKNIPYAFLMASMHDDYHRPSDTVDKINPGLLEDITRLTYLTAFSLADK